MIYDLIPLLTLGQRMGPLHKTCDYVGLTRFRFRLYYSSALALTLSLTLVTDFAL
jgi:hypothetical protein